MSVNWRPTLPIFRELGCAQIGGRFTPITAPHVLCTVKKNLKYFQNFFSYSCFDILKLFSCEKTFFELILWYGITNFSSFSILQLHNILLCKNFRRKYFRKNGLEFFCNSSFSRFFQGFFTYHVLSQWVLQIFEKFKLLCALGTWG